MMVQVGKLEIDLERREVRQNGSPLRIGSRALNILELLIEANGELVRKDEILSRVWPDTFVEENNLQVHVAALRKALGDDRGLIKTVPGRGYQLVSEMTRAPDNLLSLDRCAIRELPAQNSALVGRDAAIVDIAAVLEGVPVLTLVGSGGIGKTSLAIRVAHYMSDRFGGDVRFIELAALAEPDTVLVAVAEACGKRFSGGVVSATRIAETLSNERCLIVFDNAEHVIDVIASLVATLVPHNHNLRVMVTSREPLRIACESIFRVHPLEVPAVGAPLDQLLASPAVHLFVQRARSLGCDPGIDGQSIHFVSDICRRLDGIPLAIELAAARSAALGVAGVYSRLDDRLHLLTGGHRDAAPRHQTLRATLDWSYALLDPRARAVFRRLGMFAGVFTLEAVLAVAMDCRKDVAAAVESIGELTGKSLINVELDDSVARYRLPESTRAYAMEKLRDEGETSGVAAKHVEFLRERFSISSSSFRPFDERAAQPEFRQILDDARGAFDWAFSAEGDLRLGVLLASTLVGTLLECSLVEECCVRATRAVAALDALPSGTVDASCDIRLRAALASTLLHTRGPVTRCAELWQQVLCRAIEVGDDEDEGRALWGLWNAMLSSADIHASMRYAIRYRLFAIKRGSEWQRIQADQLVAFSLHFMGEHSQARERLEHARAQLTALSCEMPRGGGFAVDPLVFNNGTLARIAWLQGFPDRAMELVEQTVTLVRDDMLEPSLSHVLAVAAIPLSLLTGDLRAAHHYLGILRSQVAQHRFDIWREYCDCLSAQVDILSGRCERGLPTLKAALDALSARGFRRLLMSSVALHAEALAQSGQIAEAKKNLGEALDYCAAHGEQLFVPELWRVMGLTEIAQAGLIRDSGGSEERVETHHQAARQYLVTAIGVAQQQGARMWELRASISLAKLLMKQGLSSDAHNMLITISEHFDMRSTASDVRNLFALIQELNVPSASGKDLMLCAPAQVQLRRTGSPVSSP
jgi:predicted ATPase/DNA-binding winged helix-turn-helix (wHTH) protein